MVLHLAEQLDIPLRDRNALLIAAGYAPLFPERTLDDPALRAARHAIDLVLAGHEPYPAVAIDRHFMMVASNNAVAPFLAGVDPSLMQPPVNVLRLTLHPDGMASRIVNLAEWRAHLLTRLRRHIDLTGDAVLIDLLKELSSYAMSDAAAQAHAPDSEHEYAGVVVPLQLVTDAGVLAFFGTTTIFGTPIDITLSEIALEAFYPADAQTAEALRRVGRQPDAVQSTHGRTTS
jgi:MmyB-like transcription regulator ligand binding domain